MWDYTEKVMDHFLHPRNVGEIKNADGVGEVGNIICGDAMKLYVKLAEDGKTIDQVTFQTYGCASAIASASALTEMLHGKTIEEASKLTNQDIADFLGELPEEKMHCSVMGMEAFQAALKNIHANHPEVKMPEEKIEDLEDRIICECFGVTERKIREVVTQNHLKTVEQVTHYCKAGGGCGSCLEKIQEVLDKILAEEKGAAPAVHSGAAPMTNLQKIQKIQEVFAKVICPGLQADGGDAELVDVNGDEVYVRLRGRCAVCPSAIQTLKHWVEVQLREQVCDTLVVIQTK